MKKIIGALVMLTAILLLGGCAVSSTSGTKISKVSIDVEGYEFGPAVPKLIIQLNNDVSKVTTDNLKVKTAGVDRTVTSAYLSTKNGKKTSKKSKYITIETPIGFDSTANAGVATPFSYNMSTFQNNWVETYDVSIKGLEVSSGQKSLTLKTDNNVIANRYSADLSAFTVRDSYSGTYRNDFTKQDENITLNYAAYEPKKLADGAKNPLIIWLHGQGEGGTDTDITLLGNEVTALARDAIQSHFTAGEQTGAYVLAVQAKTYWMDEGDGTNGAGSGVSRYTQALMDVIKAYVKSNPDVDTSRIYLAGGSNGGYMTLNMAVNYPDYFAALVPQAAAYAYYNYERQDDGSYIQVDDNTKLSGKSPVRTDDVYFTEDKIAALSTIPIWFIHAANDTVVDPNSYALPVYKALIDSGASNKWFSYYESVEGSDVPRTSYLGHWSWIYFFNDQVSGVQDVAAIQNVSDLSGFSPSNATKGGTSIATVDGVNYSNLFDWLNAQQKK
ncbi:prolyl oligopeptidase family serine peptidase [Streptococcus dentiloxodontae]